MDGDGHGVRDVQDRGLVAADVDVQSALQVQAQTLGVIMPCLAKYRTALRLRGSHASQVALGQRHLPCGAGCMRHEL